MELLLAGRVVTHNRVDVAVDETGGKGDAVSINFGCGPFAIEVFRVAPSVDLAINRNHAIAVKNGFFQLSRKDLTDVLDDELFHGDLPICSLAHKHASRVLVKRIGLSYR